MRWSTNRMVVSLAFSVSLLWGGLAMAGVSCQSPTSKLEKTFCNEAYLGVESFSGPLIGSGKNKAPSFAVSKRFRPARVTKGKGYLICERIVAEFNKKKPLWITAVKAIDFINAVPGVEPVVWREAPAELQKKFEWAFDHMYEDYSLGSYSHWPPVLEEAVHMGTYRLLLANEDIDYDGKKNQLMRVDYWGVYEAGKSVLSYPVLFSYFEENGKIHIRNVDPIKAISLNSLPVNHAHLVKFMREYYDVYFRVGNSEVLGGMSLLVKNRRSAKAGVREYPVLNVCEGDNFGVRK